MNNQLYRNLERADTIHEVTAVSLITPRFDPEVG